MHVCTGRDDEVHAVGAISIHNRQALAALEAR